MSLEEKVTEYITNIEKQINWHLDKKTKMLLLSDAINISELIYFQDLDVIIPKKITNFIKKNNLNYLSKKINDIFLDNFYMMHETNEKICNLKSFIPDIKPLDDQDFNTYSMDEAINLSLDFFDYYDTDIYKHLKNMVLSDDIHVVKIAHNDFIGANFHLSTQKNDIMLIDNKVKNIFLPSTIIHETIHSYIYSFFKSIGYEEIKKVEINALDEVYSHFIELGFAKYLEEIKNKDSSIITHRLAYDLKNYLSHFDYFFKNFNNISNNNQYLSAEIYAYGLLLAYHYLDKYLENDMLTKENILNLSINSKDYDRKYLLNNYGLNEEEICNPHTLIKHMPV